MRVGFLRAGVLLGGLIGVVVLVGSGACGGNVVLDGSGGYGGNGGSSSTSVSSTVTVNASVGTTVASTGISSTTGVSVGVSTVASTVSSTGTGPACSCSDVCMNAAPCGVPSNTCLGFCATEPAATLACLCNAGNDCAALASCLGVGATSAGATTAAATSTSSGGAQTCEQCEGAALAGPCAPLAVTCGTNSACAAIAECHNQCGFAPSCQQQCDAANPSGEQDYDALAVCTVCKVCSTECAGQQVATDYCP